MKKSTLHIVGFESHPLHSNFYNLIAESGDRNQKLNLLLNQYEAQVISHIFSGGRKNQLFAYGSMGSLMQSLDIKLSKVELQKNEKGQLSAYLFGSGSWGAPFKSMVRPVDALIFSLLHRCPVYFAEHSESNQGKEVPTVEEKPLENLSLKELKDLLAEYIAQENYEEACVIRDLMQERKQKIA